MSLGSDTLLIIGYTMSSRAAVGMSTMARVQAGLLTHKVLAILGLSIVIASSALLFQGIAIAGAACLAWLGFQGLRAGGGRVWLGTPGGQVWVSRAIYGILPFFAAAMILTNVLAD